MPEELPAQQFEQEVSQISRAIEARRNALEQEHGIVEEEKVARETISEHLKSAAPQASTTPKDDGKSYVDTLPEESARKVEALVQEMREKGISKTISDAQENEPYILDAFHDTLVDKLYNELKERGYV